MSDGSLVRAVRSISAIGRGAMAYFISVGVFLAWAILVAASDIRYRRIPNSLVFGGVAAAFASALCGASPFGIAPLHALLGMLVGMACLLPFFVARVMGAADVKVFAALGAWCGVHGLLWLWIAASLVACLHALAVLLLTRTPLRALRGRSAPTLALGRYRATPYGACLAIPAALWLVCVATAGGVR